MPNDLLPLYPYELQPEMVYSRFNKFFFLGNIPSTASCYTAATTAPECDKHEQHLKQCLPDSPAPAADHDEPRSVASTATYTFGSVEATISPGCQRSISVEEWKHTYPAEPSAVSAVAVPNPANATTTATQHQSHHQNPRSYSTEQRIPSTAAKQKSGRSGTSFTGPGHNGSGNRSHSNQSTEATRAPTSTGSYSSCSANKSTNANGYAP